MSTSRYIKSAILFFAIILLIGMSACKKGFSPNQSKIDAAEINQEIKKNIENAEKATDENEKAKLYGIASRLLCKKGDFNKASVIARLGQKANPTNKDSMTSIGEYYLYIKKFNEAEFTFSNVLANFPDDPDANYLMGNTLAAQEKYSRSVAYYKKNIKSEKPSDESYINLAYAYNRMGEKHDAYSTLSDFIESSNTENAYAYKNAGVLAESLEKNEDAKKYYNRYLELNPYGDDVEAVTKWRDAL